MGTRVSSRGGKTYRTTTFNAGVEVQGLADFNRALKEVSDAYPNETKKANYALARTLRDKAREGASRDSKLANKAAKSLRVSRTATSAAIVGGGARYPFFFGAEFGAKRYRQFKAWRGNQWGGWSGGPGYFLHPAIRRYARPALDEYMASLDALADRAFPD